MKIGTLPCIHKERWLEPQGPVKTSFSPCPRGAPLWRGSLNKARSLRSGGQELIYF